MQQFTITYVKPCPNQTCKLTVGNPNVFDANAKYYMTEGISLVAKSAQTGEYLFDLSQSTIAEDGSFVPLNVTDFHSEVELSTLADFFFITANHIPEGKTPKIYKSTNLTLTLPELTRADVLISSETYINGRIHNTDNDGELRGFISQYSGDVTITSNTEFYFTVCV